MLTSGTPTHYLARVYLTNRAPATEDGEIEPGRLAAGPGEPLYFLGREAGRVR